nr:transposase (putative), gypsy type [Tanacetum cinerariifolium]
MPLKRDLRLIDEHIESMSVDVISNIVPSDVKTVKTIDVNHEGVFSTEEPKPVMENNFSPPIIEDWHSDDESEVEISPTVEVVKPVWNNTRRVNHKNFANKFTHLHPKRGFVPQGVLTRSGKINTAGASVTTADRPVNIVDSKSTVNHLRLISKAFKRGHSQDTRPYNKFSANKSSIFNKKVNTVRVNDSTARDKAVVSGNIRRQVNAFKALGCWVWRPKQNVTDHVSKQNSASLTLKRFDYIDIQGRVLDMEKIKTAQAKEFADLKKRVKKLERKRSVIIELLIQNTLRVYEMDLDHYWVGPIDSFACPILFPWHTAKNVTRDPAPVSTNFSAHDYATLVVHPSSFRKFPEEFLCLVGLSLHYTLDEKTYPRFLHKNGEDMDLFAFIHAPDPTKVKIVEREQVGDESLLLQTTVSRIVPLLLVAPNRANNELETSIDRMFDEGGSGSQVPRHQRKRKTAVAEAGGSSHAPKKLKEDYRTTSGPPMAGKSRSAIQRLLVGAVLNVEVRGDPIHTFPIVTSSVSAMPGHEDSSHHSGANVAEAEVDYLVKSSVPVMTVVTTTTPTADVVIVKEKIVGSVRTVIDPDTDLQKVDVPQWSMTNGFGLDEDRISLSGEVRMRAEYNIRENRRLKSVADEKDELLKDRDKEIKNLKAHMVLKEAEAAEAIRLRAKASNFMTVEKSLWDKVNVVNEHYTILEKERNSLDVKVADLEASAVIKEHEMTYLGVQLTSVKSYNDSLVDRVHKLEVASFGLQEKLSNYENLTKRLEEFQDAQLKIVNDKFYKMYVDFVEMALHLEERLYPHLLTTIFGCQWLLTRGMELAVTKCLHSLEYLFVLIVAISKAIVKGMLDGLAAGITHGQEALLMGTEGAFGIVLDVTSALSTTLASASLIPPISTDGYW